MDIIKFPQSSGSALNLVNASIVENWDTVTWIERYRDPGEFTIVAEASPYILKELAVSCLISHANTPEIMIVENHEIESNAGEPDKVTITGRSFETFLEQRIIGSNRNWSEAVYPLADVTLASERIWNQTATLINDHIRAGFSLNNDSDGFTNVWSIVNPALALVGFTGEETARIIKRGELYAQVLELLALESCGIRSSRPGPMSVLSELYESPPDALILEIHKGADLSAKVAFSNDLGDLETANYLSSIKGLKTAALVSGRWVEMPIYMDPENVGYDRRWMFIDASDLDNKLSEAPTGGELEAIKHSMVVRGKLALSNQNGINIVNPKVSESASRYKYREDYRVGDLVGVYGEYNTSTIMRVIEHVEIEDDEGESGYPTLSEL